MNPNLPLDLASLRAFDAVATLRNFRRAARAVALSPAALSTRIRLLEEELGTTLLVRTTRSVRLTVAGERVHEAARRALLQAEAVRAAARDVDEAPFSLTIGTRHELGMSWIVPQLAALHKDRPARKIHLDVGSSDELLARVERGQLDAVVTSARHSSALLTSLPLHREDYVAVAAPALLHRIPLRRAADASKHVLLDADRSLPLFRYLRDATEGGDVWRFADVEYLGAIAAMKHRACEGAGVCVLPRYFVEPELKRGNLVRWLPRQPILHDVFRLVHRTDHVRQAELAALAAFLRRGPLR